MSLQNNNSRQPLVSRAEWIVLALLVVLAIAARFWIETPNVKPLAAFALFGGFFFRRPLIGVFGMLFVLMITDLQLGIYQWQLMVCVYLSLAISALLGVILRKQFGASRMSWSHLIGFLGASLTMSTLFYLLTNGGVWLLGGWYPLTFVGMVECYVAALPFYRWTLLGDLFFTTLTIGCYSIAVWSSAYLATIKRKQAKQLIVNSC